MQSNMLGDYPGICLGFDVPEEMLLKVRYRKDRLKLNRKSEFTKGDVISLLTVKFSEWRYERERRIMTPLQSAVKEANRYFEPFCDNLKLREILLGIKCPQSEDVFKRLIEKKYKDQDPINIHKLSLAVTKFGITKTIHKLQNA